jgi:hypothetical protein
MRIEAYPANAGNAILTGEILPSPNHMNRHANIQVSPALLGGIDFGVETDGEREAGSVAQREAVFLRRCN